MALLGVVALASHGHLRRGGPGPAPSRGFFDYAFSIFLILFVLTHGGDPAKPFRYMIGRAKPMGAGQTRVVSATLNLEANTHEGKPLLHAPEDREKSAGGREGFCPGAMYAWFG